MKYEQFIQPEIINVGDREFAISKIPAFQAKSVYNDLVVKIRDNGDIGKTMLSDESIKTMFRFCAVRNDNGEMQVLETVSAIEQFCVDTKMFVELMLKIEDYNFDFLTNGTLRDLLGLPAEGATESAS